MDGRLAVRLLGAAVVIVVTGFRIWLAFRPEPEPEPIYLCYDTPVFSVPAPVAPATTPRPATPRPSSTPCE